VAKHKSEEVLMNSTSGGIFTAISDAILRCAPLVNNADYWGIEKYDPKWMDKKGYITYV